MVVVGFLFIVVAVFFVFRLMVVDGFCVNDGSWIFCSLWWLGFCVYDGGWVFVLDFTLFVLF